MHDFATTFASSPAGWIAGFGGIIAGCGVPFALYSLNRQAARQDRVDGALVEMGKSLAIVVAQIQPMTEAILSNTNDIHDLEATTAVLKDAREQHDKWAATQADALARLTERVAAR